VKTCIKCKEQKSLDSFSRSSKNSDGHQQYCKICYKQYDKHYHSLNRDDRLIQMQEYQMTNKDKIASRKRSYQKNNKDKINAIEAKRRASKLQATPHWLTEDDLEQIKNFYSEAQLNQALNGIEYHVDHIVPLQGENVCGLHVPWNLQVIPAKENMRKSNRLEKETNEAQNKRH
jgi:hypothetical protein